MSICNNCTDVIILQYHIIIKKQDVIYKGLKTMLCELVSVFL